MKKTIMTSLAALALGLATTASASFLGLSGTGTFERLPGYGRPNGAEYTWNFDSIPAQLAPLNGYTAATARVNGKLSIQTFCLERNEAAGDGTFVLNSLAVGGGGGAGPAGDPISIGTAWLYSQFARGILAGYDYTPGNGRRDSADVLQTAIWMLENEVGVASNSPNFYYDLAQAKFAGAAAADAPVGAYKVYAMNITADDGSLKQDFLITVPEGGSVLIILGLSLCGLSVFRSRLQKKTA